MKQFKNLISKITEGLTKYVFTLSTLVTLLFLSGISTLVYVFFQMHETAGWFVLGLSFLYVSFILAAYISTDTKSKQK